jgi:hypothetical protein
VIVDPFAFAAALTAAVRPVAGNCSVCAWRSDLVDGLVVAHQQIRVRSAPDGPEMYASDVDCAGAGHIPDPDGHYIGDKPAQSRVCTVCQRPYYPAANAHRQMICGPRCRKVANARRSTASRGAAA